MTTSRLRCAVVALVLTAAGSGAAVGLVRLLARPTRVEDAVVQPCLALLLGCTAWAWAAGLAAVAEAWRGVPRLGRGGVVRRIVLAACGVAVTATLLAPGARAADGDPLAGLPLPQRATDGPRQQPAHPDRVVVRAGDTLWALAAHRLPADAPAGAVDAAWRELYAANRAALGPDPDLIQPGQVLDLPTDQPRNQEDR